MERLSPISEESLNEAQRAVYDAITSGPRGRMGLAGPFGVYVRVPGIGDPTQALGAAVRFGTSLPENLKEIAICVVGSHCKAKFEFAAHARMAVKAGVDAAAVEALRRGETPELARDDERVVYEVSTQLVRRQRIDDETYARAKTTLGETQLIELVTTVGYYGLVSLILNAFEIPLREGMKDPFPEV